MNKFKIGDRVVVVDAQSVYDNYSNGDVGTVNGFDSNPSVAGFVRRDYDGLEMNVYWTEVIHLKSVKKSPMPEKETEMTAEQIREEIFRMDSRIEEAKKDIENADKERTALVEKLREKGFEIVGSNPAILPGDLVRIIGTQSPRHSENHVGKKGVVEKVDDSDVPYKVILSGSDEASNTWFNSDQVQKI